MKTLKTKTRATIKSIKKDILIETNKEFLDVEIEINGKNGEIVTRKLAFPFEKTSEEIKEAVKKYVETFNADAELAEKNKEREKLNSQADKIIKNLEGVTI